MPTVLNGFKHQRIAFNEFYFILMSKFYDSLPVVGFIRRYMWKGKFWEHGDIFNDLRIFVIICSLVFNKRIYDSG